MVVFISVCALIYIFLCLCLYFMQGSLVFIPQKIMEGSPDNIGLQYEDVELDVEPGIKIHGWFVPCADAKGTVLFLHGNAGNISTRLDTIRVWHQMGYNMMLIDYRGYGKSTGSPTETGVYKDTKVAWNYLTEEKKIAAMRIVIFGRSLGGAMASWLATQVPSRLLILESTFTSVPDIASDSYPIFPTRKLSRFQFDTLSRLKQIKCPILISHSPDDDVIPYKHGLRLQQEAKDQDSVFMQLQGGHNAVQSGQEYIDGLKKFLNHSLPEEDSFSSGS